MLLVRIFDTLTNSVLKHQTCALKSNGVTHVDISSLAHLMDSFFFIKRLKMIFCSCCGEYKATVTERLFPYLRPMLRDSNSSGVA